VMSTVAACHVGERRARAEGPHPTRCRQGMTFPLLLPAPCSLPGRWSAATRLKVPPGARAQEFRRARLVTGDGAELAVGEVGRRRCETPDLVAEEVFECRFTQLLEGSGDVGMVAVGSTAW